MPGIVPYPVQSLAFTPAHDALGKELSLRWKLPWRVLPGRTRLLSTRHGALLADGERGWFEMSDATPQTGTLAPWKHYDLPVADLSAATDADALVLESDGQVLFWQAGSSPQAVWTSPWPAKDTVVLGLPGGRLFAQCTAEGQRQMGVVDAQSSRFIWSRKAIGNWVLPAQDLLFMELDDAYNVLVALKIASGKQKWKSKPVRAGLNTVIGVVDDLLWVATRESSLCAFDIGNGNLRTEIKVKNNRVPLGRLDQDGRLHLCQGLNYHVLDLRAGGKVLSYTEFRLSEKGPSTAPGNLAWPLPDGRLVFHDDRGRIWCSSPESSAQPKLVWESQGGIAGMTVAHEHLLALENAGCLLALGSP